LSCLLAVAALAAPATASGSTIVSLGFDDAWADQYQVRSMLSQRGLHATFFINSGFLGRSNRLTLAQAQALASDGNEIGGHTTSHADLTTLAPDERRRQVCDDRVTLMAAGLQIKSFAYPHGKYDDLAKTIVRDCGYNSARTVGGIVSSCSGCPFAESVPPADPFATRTPAGVYSTTTLETLQGFVTQAEQHGGGWVQIVLHHVCDGCGTLAISPAVLGQFLDWLVPRAQTGTVVRTVSDVVGGALKPPVPASPLSGNLLQNPSLESDQNADAVPDCWFRAGYGTNTFTWARTTDAHTGGFADRLDITTLSSGDRKLITPFDQGACAPSVSAGRSYRFSGWFKASAPVRVLVYARDSSGAWSFWTKSANFAASSTWAEASWTTPPVPQGVTALSVGLALSSVGSASFDDFALRADAM
jgi:peptidoglycan/xylan/chitin deacetylase (PgdA/CDA1 family)